ncbi:MAG: carbohydrate-binding domain-containing protein [Saprospiraceae bacterium]
MKHIFTLFLIVILSNAILAQQNINFHIDGSTDSYQLSEGDSLYFNADHTVLYFFNDGNIIENAITDVDSITFSSDVSKNVYIEYLESSVSIDNPLSDSGVEVEVDGANVTITSTSDMEEINYICSGTTSNGMLKVYSDEKFNLLLDGLNLTNPVGPAVNIQSEKRVFINLLPGTENMLTDGVVYDDPPIINGEEEDQKSALFSEGKIKFIGSGSLTVQGLGEDQHGIRSDEELTVFEGDITVASSEKDGIHADGFVMEGGSLAVTSFGDGIDGDEDQIEINCGYIIINSTSDDVKGIACDGTLTINGGDITLNISGDQSKGLKCDTVIMLNGGTIHGTAAGDVVLEGDDLGFDPSYCSLIKADGDLILDGATIDFVTTGEASRGISCDGNLTIRSGSISIVSSGDGAKYTNADGEDDAYHGTCMKIDEDLTIYGGKIFVSNSGSGGRGISTDGDIIYGNDGSSQPELEIVTTGESITITSGSGGPFGNNGDYDESKAMKADGIITINSGTIQISSADDAVKSDESIVFNNGTLEISNSVEGLEAPFITVNNGIITVAATDDGFNATMGTEVTNDDGSQLDVNGGTITVNMSGNDVDAMDSNGDITILGGTVYLNFPTQGPNRGLDANGTVTIGPDATVYENGVEL